MTAPRSAAHAQALKASVRSKNSIAVQRRDWHWPAFNLADAAIVTGLAIAILFHDGKSASKRAVP